MPSKLREVYWENTLADLRAKTKLRVGYEHTRAVQDFSTIARVVSMAFGGVKEEGKPPPNIAAAKASLAAVFGG